ncbi:MAG: protease complex subunit PrcB family protein [Alphaproteobacteria bacterium]
MKLAVIFICALILVPAHAALSGGNPQQWSGAFSPYQQFSAQVIRDAESWSQIWAQLHQPPPQSFDAGRHMALAVFLGLRTTGGYDLAIEPANRSDAVLLFRVRELAPAPDALVPQVLTNPYRILILPASTRPVFFLLRLRGVASGECLYIPAGERRRIENVAQLPTIPTCPKAAARRNKRS